MIYRFDGGDSSAVYVLKSIALLGASVQWLVRPSTRNAVTQARSHMKLWCEHHGLDPWAIQEPPGLSNAYKWLIGQVGKLQPDWKPAASFSAVERLSAEVRR